MNLEKLREAEALFLHRYPGGFHNEEMQKVLAKRHNVGKLSEFTAVALAKKSFTKPGAVLDDIVKIASRSERLQTNAEGKVVYELKHPFRDGTTHILFAPQDFIARLAALVPRPRANLTRYHGVFAPNSPFRKAIVPSSPKPTRRKPKRSNERKVPEPTADEEPPTAPLTWAQRLKRVFEIDISVCPNCGGTLRVIADITHPDVIRTILDHLRQRAPPAAPPRRASPAPSTDDLFAAS